MRNELHATENRDIKDGQAALTSEAVQIIGASLRSLLADVFTLHFKTKNFHWHMRGRHFRDYHLLLDEQADQLFAMSDVLAERSRKIGVETIHSVGEIVRLQRLSDNDLAFVAPETMLSVLCEDNRQLTNLLHETHKLCDQGDDFATASLLENWIDEAEKRSWFLSVISVNG